MLRVISSYRDVPRGLAVLPPLEINNVYTWEWAPAHMGAGDPGFEGWRVNGQGNYFRTHDGWWLRIRGSVRMSAELIHVYTKCIHYFEENRSAPEGQYLFTRRVWRESEAIVRAWREGR